MLKINRLSIRLPSGYEHRAREIAYSVGEALASSAFRPVRNMHKLEVSPINVQAHDTDGDIAESIARKIAAAAKEDKL